MRGMVSRTMGSRKTVPLRIDLIVPFGLFHIFFNPNSIHTHQSRIPDRPSLSPLTRSSSGVMVAHLIPTLCSRMAFAASTVTWSFVASRLGRPRSYEMTLTSTKGKMSYTQCSMVNSGTVRTPRAIHPTFSLIIFQMIRVISSPSKSTTGLATAILDTVETIPSSAAPSQRHCPPPIIPLLLLRRPQ